jgi:TolB-like protein
MKILIVLIITMIPFSVFSQQKNTIAVMELDPVGISMNETKILSARLRTDLFNTNKYIVLEREKMEEILTEQGFQLSGCTSNECVVEVGQLLGVQQIVAGSVGKAGNLITLTIRLIDVESGRILKTATEDCRCEIEDVITKSIKNVAQILSGNQVKLESYKNASYQISQKFLSPFSVIFSFGYFVPDFKYDPGPFYKITLSSFHINAQSSFDLFASYLKSSGSGYYNYHEQLPTSLTEDDFNTNIHIITFGIHYKYFFNEDFRNFFTGMGLDYNFSVGENISAVEGKYDDWDHSSFGLSFLGGYSLNINSTIKTDCILSYEITEPINSFKIYAGIGLNL